MKAFLIRKMPTLATGSYVKRQFGNGNTLFIVDEDHYRAAMEAASKVLKAGTHPLAQAASEKAKSKG